MKLLLVEDERMTREGIREDIEWDLLGITEVMEAFDGIQALAIAKHVQPDILLTDIRMPRMNGLELAFELRRSHPKCKIIFLTGYTDKEYLKAAISLKVTSFVEKPIDMDELTAALKSAAILCIEEKRHVEIEATAKATMYATLKLVKREVTLQLIGEEFDEKLLLQRLEIAGFPIAPSSPCATILLKTVSSPQSQEVVAGIVDNHLLPLGYTYLFAPKDDLHCILHLFGKKDNPLDSATTLDICRALSSDLKSQYNRYSITAGHIVHSYVELKQSYISAVIRMQESFYQCPCSIVTSDSLVTQFPSNDIDKGSHIIKEIYSSLHMEQFADVEAFIRSLSENLRQRPDILVSRAKEMYYRILLEMDNFANQRKISLFPSTSELNLPWEIVSQYHYLDDLQDAILIKLQQLVKAITNHGKRSLASKIMKYIHEHYMNDSLSVSEISSFMEMTSSHIISVFKENTGTTIKQYVTKYRVEKAKELLTNDRLKIFDVASQVGFKDGEYFATIFRKFTGLTPSDYRKRLPE